MFESFYIGEKNLICLADMARLNRYMLNFLLTFFSITGAA